MRFLRRNRPLRTPAARLDGPPGFDTDTEDIFERQVDFIQESGIVLATMNLLKAPPDTELYGRMKAEGRLLGRFSFDETRTNFIPAMDPETLYGGFDRLIAEVYAPDRVYDRIVTHFRDYRPPRVRTRIPDPGRGSAGHPIRRTNPT